MDIPAWLVEILRQFPIVVVIGFVLWYTDKRVREKEIRLENRFDAQFAALLRQTEAREQAVRQREDRLRLEARQDRDAEILRHTAAQQTVNAAKDELIAYLTKQLAAAMKKPPGAR